MATTNRNQHRKNKKRNRDDDALHNYWKRDMRPLHYDGYDFKTQLLRGDKSKARRKIDIGHLVTSLTWEDTSGPQTATVNFTNQDDDTNMAVVEGDEVLVQWRQRGGNHWHDLWQLRATNVDQDAGSGDFGLTMSDELEWLGRSEDDFSYKKGEGTRQHKRKNGWYAHEITQDVCRRYGVKMGAVVHGQHLIENLTATSESPLKVIQDAWAEDRKVTGRRFVIAMRNRKLSVTVMERSLDLLFLGDLVTGGTLSRALKEDFATHLIVRATGKGEGEDKEIEVEVTANKQIMKRFGKVRKIYDANDPIDTEAKAKDRGRARIAEQQQPKREISLTLPGIPTMRRGQAVELRLPQLGLNELVYVKTVSHSVSTTYDMDVTLGFSDPFIDEEGDKIRRKRCEEARKENRRLPKFCGDKKFDPAEPKKAKNRGDRKGKGGKKNGGGRR